MEFANTSPMSIVRSYPKMTLFAACVVCSPVMIPCLLLSSPFLLFTSLCSIGLLGFVRCLLELRDPTIVPVRNRCTRPVFLQAQKGLRTPARVGGGGIKDARVQEYLEDQLRNVNAYRSEAGEEPLPCSFSYRTENEFVDGKFTELNIMWDD